MKTILLACFLLLGSMQFTKAGSDKDCIVLSEFVYRNSDVDFPSCHASTLVETKTGILAAWFGGTAEKNPDVCIYVAINVKGHWQKPVKVADGIQDGRQYPCWNPVLFKRDNGDIILYYKVGPDPRSWWGM